MSFTCRTARPEETDDLSALCLRSKAHWGYDAAFMRDAEAALTIDRAWVEGGEVIVAVNEADRPVGLYRLLAEADRVIDLDLLFIDPSVIGRGVGRMLFERAAGEARRDGGRVLQILSDPNAADFYRRMGAVYRRDEPSDAIPGRFLPLFELPLEAA